MITVLIEGGHLGADAWFETSVDGWLIAYRVVALSHKPPRVVELRIFPADRRANPAPGRERLGTSRPRG
jgi:hypothetical protein